MYFTVFHYSLYILWYFSVRSKLYQVFWYRQYYYQTRIFFPKKIIFVWMILHFTYIYHLNSDKNWNCVIENVKKNFKCSEIIFRIYIANFWYITWLHRRFLTTLISYLNLFLLPSIIFVNNFLPYSAVLIICSSCCLPNWAIYYSFDSYAERYRFPKCTFRKICRQRQSRYTY